MDAGTKILLFYLAAISLVSCAVCVFDKHRAKTGGWRVRESTLLWLSAFGGSAAMYLTMKLIRHKTKHPKFMVGIPLIFAAQVFLGAFAVWYLTKK